MEKMRIRKGDNVVVIAGAYKGTKGKVLKTFAKQNRVIVEKVNLVKKHSKQTQKNPQAGIIEIQTPINCSKVMLFDEKNNRTTKAVYKIIGGKRVRVCKKTGDELNSKR